MPHEEFMSCIEACNHCANACEHCGAMCLREEDVKAMVRCIALDRDCAVICHSAAFLMGSKSEFAEEACRLCAEICRTCADECRKHDMDHCRECAEACSRCAEECERMAGANVESIS